MKTSIHPTAIIEEGAQLGNNVTVEAYAVIKKNVILHDHVTIMSHAHIEGHTTIGEGTIIYPYACIGTSPQARKYQGETSTITIGKHCHIREYVTINASLGEGSKSSVGDYCFIMAYCHIAHNSQVGNHVVMSNNATLAGHVTIEDYANIGGMTPLHQFTRIGRYAMVGGMSRVPCDVPPYTIGAGIPFRFGGLNLIGLKRHGFSVEIRRELSRAFRLMYRSDLSTDEALVRIEADLHPFPEIQHWLEFCKKSKRGLTCVPGVMGELESQHDLLEDEVVEEQFVS
ncbi:MAG: acyl-ACP--UDP-N-acetylglucosamine O-acyltransferase [Chlamydiales bacterium]